MYNIPYSINLFFFIGCKFCETARPMHLDKRYPAAPHVCQVPDFESELWRNQYSKLSLIWLLFAIIHIQLLSVPQLCKMQRFNSTVVHWLHSPPNKMQQGLGKQRRGVSRVIKPTPTTTPQLQLSTFWLMSFTVNITITECKGKKEKK